ncbi:MAG: sugar O-acyltransferase, partial [Xanthomonas perforans]|nr:sugar O-acyltransferase [Xanthomonas perforans]
IGANCFLFEGNVIQPFTRIGDNCILWSGNHIGHRTVVQDNVFIASHVVISGYCEIGRGSFIGVNATLSDKVRIAAD